MFHVDVSKDASRKIVISNKAWMGIGTVLLHLADLTEVGDPTDRVITLCRRTLILPIIFNTRNLHIVLRVQKQIRRCPICASRGSFEDVMSALEKGLQEQDREYKRVNEEMRIERMWRDLGDAISHMIMEEWRIAVLNGEKLPVELATYGTLLNFYERNIPTPTAMRYEGFIEHEPNHEEG